MEEEEEIEKKEEKRMSSIFKIEENKMIALVCLITLIFEIIPYIRIIAFVIPLIIYVIEENNIIRKSSLQLTILNALTPIVYIILFIIKCISKPEVAWSWNSNSFQVISGSKIIYGLSGTWLPIIVCLIAVAPTVIMAMKILKNEMYYIPVVSKIEEKITNNINKDKDVN